MAPRGSCLDAALPPAGPWVSWDLALLTAVSGVLRLSFYKQQGHPRGDQCMPCKAPLWFTGLGMGPTYKQENKNM